LTSGLWWTAISTVNLDARIIKEGLAEDYKTFQDTQRFTAIVAIHL
jgi:hypothetical protein